MQLEDLRSYRVHFRHFPIIGFVVQIVYQEGKAGDGLTIVIIRHKSIVKLGFTDVVFFLFAFDI